MCEPHHKYTMDAFMDVEPTSKFQLYTQCWSRNNINHNENTFRKQILKMDITGKWIQSLNADSHKRLILSKLKIYS